MRILFLHLFNRRTSCYTDLFLLKKNLQSQKLISLSGPSPSRRRMQNPLEAPTYRVGNECYRRNVPWEEVKTANPAAAAEYSGEEADTDEANDVQQTVEFSAADEQKADEMADALPNKSELQDGSEQIGSIDFMTASTSKTTAKSSVQKVELKVQGKEIKVSKNKSKAAVQVEQKEAKVELVAEKKIELIGSVKYDPKQESYNDSLRMPSALIGFLRGREGHKQKKLESKFRCNIHFPKKRSNKMETEIKIASTESANSVLNCRQEIEQLLVQARKQAMPTHFVSIPIFDPRLREQYQKLVKRIMEDEETPEECKNVKLFLPTAKLHLTICVLKLFTDEELDRAKRHLDELFRTDKIREILAKNATIRLQFPAFEHFADRSPDKVAVLFARAESERMQKLANVVDDALAETGLSERRKTENVVLHMTVMNTKYLWEKRRVFLNVGPVLAKFGQLNFDQVEVQQLHLCEMRGNNDDELNGYRSVHTVDFDAHFKD